MLDDLLAAGTADTPTGAERSGEGVTALADTPPPLPSSPSCMRSRRSRFLRSANDSNTVEGMSEGRLASARCGGMSTLGGNKKENRTRLEPATNIDKSITHGMHTPQMKRRGWQQYARNIPDVRVKADNRSAATSVHCLRQQLLIEGPEMGLTFGSHVC